MAQKINVVNKAEALAVFGTADFLGIDQNNTATLQGGEINVSNEAKAGLLLGAATYAPGRDLKATKTEVTVTTDKTDTTELLSGPTDKVEKWLGDVQHGYPDDVKSIITESTWEGEDINDEFDPENCWLCSIGGVNTIQVSELLKLTEKRGAATIKEILGFYKEYEVDAKVKTFFNWDTVIDYLDKKFKKDFEQRAEERISKAKLKVLLGVAVDGQSCLGHMVVLKARKIGYGKVHYRIIDFQRGPNDEDRVVENDKPSYATGPFIIIQTNHDIYEGV